MMGRATESGSALRLAHLLFPPPMLDVPHVIRRHAFRPRFGVTRPRGRTSKSLSPSSAELHWTALLLDWGDEVTG